jgi:hypothetical protein
MLTLSLVFLSFWAILIVQTLVSTAHAEVPEVPSLQAPAVSPPSPPTSN